MAVCVQVYILWLYTDEMIKCQKYLDVTHSTAFFINDLLLQPEPEPRAVHRKGACSCHLTSQEAVLDGPRPGSTVLPGNMGLTNPFGGGHLSPAFLGGNNILRNPHQPQCWWFLRR